MSYVEKFQPNWISSPGDTIIDLLEEKDMSISNLATQMESDIEFVRDLLDGKAFINEAVSHKLSETFGGSEEFWLSRELQYRESLLRQQKAVDQQSWLKSLPIRDMINWGWIKVDISKNVNALLQYFGVNSINEWHVKYEAEMAQVSFRTSQSFKPQPSAVAAWLRQGELQSNLVDCRDWSPENFKGALAYIRSLTKIKDPEVFLPKLIKACAECGVAVAIVRTPSGCQASGVTKFIAPNKALLMLSFRYLTDDHFWFTFFHEAGHLLLHGENSVFIEELGRDRIVSDEEKEANDFAATQLVPNEYRERLMRLPVSNKRAVIGFATELGISAGIIIGQLQYAGKIEHNKFNSYKRRYSWDNILNSNH